MLRRLATCSLLPLLLACGACGTNDNLLNTRKGEKVLAQWLAQQDMPAESITCPGDIKMEKGTSFLCKAIIANSDGVAIDIRVHQTGDTGDIRLEHASDVLVSERVERGVRGQILDQISKKVDVDCGARVRLAVPSTKFRCRVEEQNAGANRTDSKPETFEMEITMLDTEVGWQAQRL